MAELPFLVVHGALVWKVVDVALAAGAIAGVNAIRTRRARRDVRTVVQAWLSGVVPLRERRVSVRGHLRGGSLATLARGEEHHEHATGTPWIECDGGTRVELGAVPRVIAGSRAATAIVGVPRATPARLRGEARGGRWTLATIADGDEVIVSGHATRSAKADADYRADATEWRIAEHADTPLEIVAIAPAARPAPPHPVARTASFAALLLVWFGALHVVGSRAKARATETPERVTRHDIAPFGALAIAAAMPGSRDEALADVAAEALDHYGHRGSTFALADALDGEVGVCQRARHQLDEVRLDDALASARACGDRDLESTIQLFRGDYAAALALAPTRPYPRELAAVGTRMWLVAANAADEAGEVAAGPDSGYTDREYAERAARIAHCRAAMYRVFAGAPDAFASQPAKLDGGEPMCVVMAAAVLPLEQRRVALRQFLDAQENLDLDRKDVDADIAARALLTSDDAPYSDYDDYADVAFGVSANDWLIASAPRGAEVSDSQRECRAGVDVVRGDFAAAHAELAATAPGMHHDTIAMLLAMRQGLPVPQVSYVHPAFEREIALRAGKVEGEFEGIYPDSCKTDELAAIARALAGDGGPLATVFTDCKIYYNFMPEQLWGVLPHVQQHRAELADALRAYRDDITTYSFDHVPFRLMQYLADYRDTARLVGDDTEAERLQAVISRHASVLGDRERLIALVFLAR